VFGELGERVKAATKAWGTACEEAPPPLVGLHFHGLRHEAGCRWLEQGWPIHHVQEMLGHANSSQTSTYLHATETGLAESMRKFDASRCIPVADEKPIGHPSIGNEETDDATKSTLH
jgi:integrase